MISLSNIQAKIAATKTAFETQKGSEAGANLVVDGSGNGVITTDIDDTVILLADGDDIVTANSDNNVVTAKSGNNQIYINGDNNFVEGGKDEDYIVSIGQHNDLNGGDGNDVMLSIGDNNKMDGGDGDNYIAFKGNHLHISDGNGSSMFRTLDFAIMEGNFEQYADYLADQTTTNTKESTVLLNTQINTDTQVETTGTGANTLEPELSLEQAIAQLADIDKEYLEGIDFNEVDNKGFLKYIIAKGKSDGLYHIYESCNDINGTQYKAVAGFDDKGQRVYDKIASENGYLSIYSARVATSNVLQETEASSITTTTTTTTETTKTYKDIQNTTTYISGLEDIVIKTKNGADDVKVNVAKDLVINGDDVVESDKAKNIFVVGGITIENTTENIRQEVSYNTTVNEQTKEVQGLSYGTSSPLIVDFNKDGKVSAQAGIGVDIDGNGYSDGAAVNGDKMLAMSDMNGNGVVDGTEVFGDKTVSPFTGKALNAANGFEALKLIAQEAEEYAGINCMNANGDVDLRKLQEALKTVNINLGFISDKNNTTIEDLAHVASINVSDYTEQSETGEVQHNQLGSYTDTDGQTYKTDDVWFKLFGKK